MVGGMMKRIVALAMGLSALTLWSGCERAGDEKKRPQPVTESKDAAAEAWRNRLKAAKNEAARWQADEKKYIEALNNVAALYAQGAQQGRVHHLEARSWCAEVAASGAGYSGETVIGAFFLYGDHVTRDAGKAREWLEYGLERPGRQRGNALYMLGLIYFQGDGVKADVNRAVDYWHRAADEEHPASLMMLGRAYMAGKFGLEKDVQGGLSMLERAANGGDASASAFLGRVYAKGEGVVKDMGRAMKWYEQGAAAGNAHCQYIIGMAYIGGEGVSVDKAKGFNWLRMAAGQEHVNAMGKLAECYANGVGVEADDEMARVWKQKALQLDAKRKKERQK